MRILLKFLMFAGVILILWGPFMYISNEGIDDGGGPLHVSLQWRRATYFLIPCGAALTIVAGGMLVWMDRAQRRPPEA